MGFLYIFNLGEKFFWRGLRNNFYWFGKYGIKFIKAVSTAYVMIIFLGMLLRPFFGKIRMNSIYSSLDFIFINLSEPKIENSISAPIKMIFIVIFCIYILMKFNVKICDIYRDLENEKMEVTRLKLCETNNINNESSILSLKIQQLERILEFMEKTTLKLNLKLERLQNEPPMLIQGMIKSRKDQIERAKEEKERLKFQLQKIGG